MFGHYPPAAPVKAGDQAATFAIESEEAGASDVLPAAQLRDGGIAVTVRRYAGAADTEQARRRVVDAFSVLLKDRGYRVASAGEVAAISIEIDPFFEMWTNKFNPRRVRLVEYVDYQLKGEVGGEAVKAPQKPLDVSRVVGGAIGLATGILTPAHATAMIGDAVVRGTGTSTRLNEATYALFGQAGHGPNYSLMPKLKERADTGQQSVTTVMRVKTNDGNFVRGVRSFIWSDDLPFQVERLAAESFARAIGTLSDSRSPQ
jgi:hypothetical protein